MAKFSLSSIPSASSVLSAYASFQASAMVAGAVISEVQSMGRRLIPQKLREKILSKFQAFAGNLSSQMTLVFHQYNNGLSNNEIFQASEIYLQTKIGPSVKRLKVSKEPGEKGLTIRVNKGEKIIDTFQGIELVWQMISIDKENKGATDGSVDIEETQQISIELSFHEKYKDKVLSSYLPHVLKRSKAVEEENKVVKLHSLSGSWNLDHPSTFQTLAMDPALKKELMADLDRFVRRRQFYQRVGKVWKRGYLLYGPPGTGKSSLIAAMANYLKFHVYDLELTGLRHNSDLRRALLRTTSRSIIVIEDIDCSTDFENRRNKNTAPGQLDNQLTLSGLLNFADGIWSSCGDGRIIVFTTNHKDRLDPALLRPGRMDLHIHMSYCTADGFRLLASNYLGITSHFMLIEIEKLITEVEATPAEIAEELMKSEEPDIALAGLITFLQDKKAQRIKANIEGEKETATGDKKPKQKAKAKLGRKKSLRKERAHSRARAKADISRINCALSHEYGNRADTQQIFLSHYSYLAYPLLFFFLTFKLFNF